MRQLPLALLIAAALLDALTTGAVSSDLLLNAAASNVAAPGCDIDDILVFQTNQPSAAEVSCAAKPRAMTETEEDRAYLIASARPGETMTRQGREVAIGRLHPEFISRLANAIREAKQAGLPSAGIFSAYRPPVFGIGGFVDKFNSLHTYGLAVDVSGIGRPGSAEAVLWHEIAAKHGVACPYGPFNPTEWNHCQPTRIKLILADNPLRSTVTEQGPISLDGMFRVGNSFIEDRESVAVSVPALGQGLQPGGSDMPLEQRIIPVEGVKTKLARVPMTTPARRGGLGQPPSWCWALRNPRQDKCGMVNVTRSSLVGRLRPSHPPAHPKTT